MAASTKSYTKYELSGTAQSQFPLNFPYFNVSDITVELPPDYTGTYTINASTNTVELSSPISVGTVLIRRSTPDVLRHLFANLMRFNFAAVDDAFTQVLYWFQETRDSLDFLDATALLARIVALEAYMQSLGSALGASLVGFLQAGTGAVLRTIQSRLRERISVLDFGADNTGSVSASSAIQACLDAAGVGAWVYVPAGIYKITVPLQLKGGQVLQGAGWKDTPGSAVITAGTEFRWYGSGDVGVIEAIAASDVLNDGRGGLRDLAVTNYSGNTTQGCGYKAVNRREQILDNVYFYGFPVGVYQGRNCWQWAVRTLWCLNCTIGLYAADEGEDSTYTSCIFRSYSATGKGVYLKNMSQTSVFLGCDFSDNQYGLFMEQGDTNGDGTGTPYPMHVTLLNCQFEDMVCAAVALTTSNQNAAISKHPGLVAIGCRAYISGTWGPAVLNAGQAFVYGPHYSQIKVANLVSEGYSYGGILGQAAYGGYVTGTSPGALLWEAGPGAVFGTATFLGNKSGVSAPYGQPTLCSLGMTATSIALSGGFGTPPYSTAVSDYFSWGNTGTYRITPTRAQRTRFKASLYLSSAVVGARHAVILKKNGADLAVLAEYTPSSTNPVLLAGEWSDTPNGTSDYYSIALYCASGTSVSITPSNCVFTAELVGV